MQYILGQTTNVSGFVTSEKFVINQSLTEIEIRLGYQSGRLRQGASFLLLTAFPPEQDPGFELYGYSNIPGHKFRMPSGLEEKKLKEIVLQHWKNENVQLVKVIPKIEHNDSIPNDIQYRRGHGVPQWRLTKEYPAKVVGVFTPHDYANHVRYRRNNHY